MLDCVCFLKMVRGTQIKDLKEDRMASPKTKLLVNKVINFLAPFFGISLEDVVTNKKVNLPKVYISNCAGYENNIVYLPECVRETDIIVGHEIGHWFHDFVNPKVFRFEISFRDNEEISSQRAYLLKFLKESVAIYSHTIYWRRKNPIQNPTFSLSALSRMSLNEANSKYENLKNFYWEELVPGGNTK